MLIMVILAYLNYNNSQRYIDQINTVEASKELLNEEKEFLNRNLNHLLNLNKFYFPELPENKDIIVYYSGESCSSCAQDLLLVLSKNNNLEDRVLVIVDDTVKSELPIDFNDGFRTNYDYKNDTTSVFKEVLFEVVVLKLNNEKRVKALLEFRPENKEVFKKYFNSNNFVN